MADNNLINYIKENLQKGFTQEQIKKTLLDSNYSQIQIEDALKEISQSQTENKKLSWKVKLPSIWILLVAILIILFFSIPIFVVYVPLFFRALASGGNVHIKDPIMGLILNESIYITGVFEPVIFIVIGIIFSAISYVFLRISKGLKNYSKKSLIFSLIWFGLISVTAICFNIMFLIQINVAALFMNVFSLLFNGGLFYLLYSERKKYK